MIWFWSGSSNGSGADATLSEAVTHSNTPSIGNVSNGEVLPLGMTFTQYVKFLHYGISYPTYLNPTLALSKNVTQYHERGSALNVTLSHVFTQRNAGALQSVSLTKNGVVIEAATTMPFTDSIIVPYGNVSYQSAVNYAAGAIQNDSEGNPYPTGAITAGTVLSDVEVVTGKTPIFFGVAADITALNAIKADIYGAANNNKTILSNEGAGSVTLNFSGADGQYLWFWIPDSVASKTAWQSSSDPNNAGAIGGTGNLFGSAQTVSVNSTGLASNYSVSGKFYATNYQTLPISISVS